MLGRSIGRNGVIVQILHTSAIDQHQQHFKPRERVKILDNLLRWKERKKRSEIGGGTWEKSGRNMMRTSRRMRSSYRMQVLSL